jgi:hypothetical protein
MLLGRDFSLDVVHGELRPQITADLRLRRLVLNKRIAEPLGGGYLAPPHERVIRRLGIGHARRPGHVSDADGLGTTACTAEGLVTKRAK